MPVKETAEVLEEAKDVVEDTVDILEDRVRWVIKNPRVLIAGALLTGIAIGAAATFLVVRKKLEIKYQGLADIAIEDVKNHYSTIHKGDKSLAQLAAPYLLEQVEEAANIVQRQGYVAYDKVKTVAEAPHTPIEEMTVTQAIVEATTIERNVFESDDVDSYFNFDEELKRREEKPDEPFVITKEEFDLSEADYDQAELSYYDGDDVLTDSQDKRVDDIDSVMGFENLLRFGHGSGDPRIVYVRNSRLGLDFEITQSDGEFAKEVLGIGELKHSARPTQRRFRQSDE